MSQKLGFWQQTLVDHLRSGYAKSKYELCKVDEEGNCSYCVLGLMCEIAYQNGCDMHVNFLPNHYGGGGSFCYDSNPYRVPAQVVSWFGLYDSSGAILGGIKRRNNCKEHNYLVDLNDETNIGFSEIANLIEANPEKFFRAVA